MMMMMMMMQRKQMQMSMASSLAATHTNSNTALPHQGHTHTKKETGPTPAPPISPRPFPKATHHINLDPSPSSMEEKTKRHKHHDQQQPPAAARPKSSKPAGEAHFKPSADVKGVRFGGQLVVRSFTVRRAGALELLRLLAVLPPTLPAPTQKQVVGCQQQSLLPFPSTTTYLPTNFTILAHHAWHTLTLGLGTRKSKVILFVFESEAMKAAMDGLWPAVIPLGEVNRRLIRGLAGCEMARFKFRKGCLTFYVYAVRRAGAAGFWRAEDLRTLLEKVVALSDFVDHTAMLALPSQRSITFPLNPP